MGNRGQRIEPRVRTSAMTQDSPAQCVLDIDFAPLKPPAAALPALSWNGVRLSHFQREDTPIEMNSSGGELLELFLAIYPQLSLMEFARLQPKWQTHFANWDLDAIIPGAQKYSKRDIDRLFAILRSLPISLQEIVAEKKLSLKELLVLTEMDFESHRTSIETILSQPISRIEMGKCLEWAVELIGMQKMPEVMSPNTMQILHAARFPLTTDQDHTKEDGFQKVRWPRKAKTRFVREGDTSSFELTVKLQKKSDLSLLIRELERCEEVLNDRDN